MITIDLPSNADSKDHSLSAPALARFLRRAQAVAGVDGDVDVLLTSDREMRRLNRSFRGKNKPTDVLSFPAPPELAGDVAGDLAISLHTAARQALALQHTLETEVRILLLHGLLHLAGMDHETDGGEMAGTEERLRRQLRLPVSLIARASGTVGSAATTRPLASKKQTAQRKPGERKTRAAWPSESLPAKSAAAKFSPRQLILAGGREAGTP